MGRRKELHDCQYYANILSDLNYERSVLSCSGADTSEIDKLISKYSKLLKSSYNKEKNK